MELVEALAFTDALVFAQTGQHLNDLQQAILRASWSWERQSYDQIAAAYGYSPTYLKHDVGPKLWKLLSDTLAEKVTKTSFRAAIERRFQLDASQLDASQPAFPVTEPPPPLGRRQDWGEAVDVRWFYGRQTELAQFEQWIEQDNCRLLALLGMGGMGKTALSVKLTQQVQDRFERVIWRSLRNAPPFADLLAGLLQFLVAADVPLPDTVEGQLSQLFKQLRAHRCLIVLDNIESILEGRSYRAGYRAYGQLFQQIGETAHSSCLVVTSRENPPEVALLGGDSLPVRVLQLSGLSPSDGQMLVQLKGTFHGSEAEWHRLIAAYGGNPLALKMIATTIQTLFDGNIADFLSQDTFISGNIRSLVEQQFERLSEPERDVIYWLAIHRDGSSLNELKADIFPPISSQQLIEVLESLEQRSLIEKNKPTSGDRTALFSLQPVVMEYVGDRLVKQIGQDIRFALHPAVDESQPISKTQFLRRYALLNPQQKDYIQDAQRRFILSPILQHLLADWNLADWNLALPLDAYLLRCLEPWRGKSALETGYTAGNLVNLLGQMQSNFNGYDLSALILWRINFQPLTLHQVNLSRSDLTHSIFAETLSIVFAVAFSPDGSTLATGDAEGGLRLWQVSDGKPLLNCTGHQGWVWAIALSADGRTLASCSSDKTIRLWSVQSGACTQILRGAVAVWTLAFSPDGQFLASGSDEWVLRIWDWAKGTCVHVLTGHSSSILAVAWSPAAPNNPQGDWIASGSADGTVRLWDRRGTCHQVLQGHGDRVWSVAFSPDGGAIASGSADGTIRIWSVETGDCIQVFQDSSSQVTTPVRIRSVAFSADGQQIISGGDDRTIRLWDRLTGQCQTVLRGHTNAIFSLALRPTGPMIASGSSDQTVRLWDSQTGRCLRTFKGYTNSVFAVAFSADGQHLASSSTDQTVRLWDLAQGSHQTCRGHEGWVTSVAVHPHGHLVASSSADQTVRLWSVSSGQCLKVLRGHTHWVQSVAFSPDGDWLVSGGDDHRLRIWSVASGQCLQTLAGHSGWVWSVVVSPTGDRLASSSEDQTIRIWQVSTGDCLTVLEGHQSRVQAIAFSPDGQWLASASSDETVRIWSVNTGECRHVLPGHQNNVWSVAFSPDGAQLASGSLDQTVRIWDVATGTCLNTWPMLTHSVRTAIAFHPTAATPTLASGSQTGTIQMWETETGQWVKTLVPDQPYSGTNIAHVTGITEAQKETLKALGAIDIESN